MKCARCDTQHQGIAGLTPVQRTVPVGQAGPLCYYDMLCGECIRAEKKKDKRE